MTRRMLVDMKRSLCREQRRLHIKIIVISEKEQKHQNKTHRREGFLNRDISKCTRNNSDEASNKNAYKARCNNEYSVKLRSKKREKVSSQQRT